jgi:hypothetical protein
LSSYLRELIHDDTTRPSMDEVVARIAAQEPVDASVEEIRAFIDDGRR